MKSQPKEFSMIIYYVQHQATKANTFRHILALTQIYYSHTSTKEIYNSDQTSMSYKCIQPKKKKNRDCPYLDDGGDAKMKRTNEL